MAEAVKAPAIREDGLQLEEHRAFQERFWTLERIAWLCFALLLLAALLGLAGAGGPLSRTTTALAGGSVEHPRVLRLEAADEIVVRFAPGGTEQVLTLPSAFARALQIEQIHPEPERALLVPGGVAMIFPSDPDASGEVRIGVRPLQAGTVTVGIGLGAGPPQSLSMLVLP